MRGRAATFPLTSTSPRCSVKNLPRVSNNSFVSMLMWIFIGCPVVSILKHKKAAPPATCLLCWPCHQRDNSAASCFQPPRTPPAQCGSRSWVFQTPRYVVRSYNSVWYDCDCVKKSTRRLFTSRATSPRACSNSKIKSSLHVAIRAPVRNNEDARSS